jgi:hypothetical protein
MSNVAHRSSHEELDRQRAAEFAGRLVKTLNEGALCLMVSIGHRTGLFDTLRDLRPATSAEIAAAAGLNERYVREWLGAMVTSGVVEVDPATQRYWLPAEHAQSLTRAAAADNMAVFAQYIGELGSVESQIVDCFRQGGGVPYEQFARFHEVMAEDSGQPVMSSLKPILPLVPGLATARAHSRIDVGCGRPVSSSTRHALSAERSSASISRPSHRLRHGACSRLADLTSWRDRRLRSTAERSFDFISVRRDPIKRPLNTAEHLPCLAATVSMMQDIAGAATCWDIHHPLGTLLYTVSCMPCRLLAQGGEGSARCGARKSIDLKRARFSSVVKKNLARHCRTAITSCVNSRGSTSRDAESGCIVVWSGLDLRVSGRSGPTHMHCANPTRPSPLALLSLAGCSDGGPPAADTAATATAPAATYVVPRTPWGDPDLQGMWPIDKLNGTPVQRPESFGERRLLTDEEFAERVERLRGLNARYDDEIANNKMGIGHWAEMGEPNRLTSVIVEPANGRVPPRTAEGERKSATMASSWSNIPFDKVADFNPLDRCITRGLPASMFPFMYNSGIEIMQAPGYVVIRLELIHESRIIPVDGRPAPAPEIRHWLGESRGHWEGDTLVVETTNFNGESPMLIVGPGAKPLPTSERLRIVERLARVDADTIDYEIAVEDPVMLTQPWKAVSARAR